MDAKIACRSVWKLYGRDPEGFLAAHNRDPSDSAIADDGYIPAVRDATLEVFAGEILVILGLSGSGKSTLVRCLSRRIEPTVGEVLFDGQDQVKIPARELIEIRRHKMGMVFQNFALLPHRTVLQNVAFPLEVQGIDRTTRENQPERARPVMLSRHRHEARQQRRWTRHAVPRRRRQRLPVRRAERARLRAGTVQRHQDRHRTRTRRLHRELPQVRTLVHAPCSRHRPAGQARPAAGLFVITNR